MGPAVSHYLQEIAKWKQSAAVLAAVVASASPFLVIFETPSISWPRMHKQFKSELSRELFSGRRVQMWQRQKPEGRHPVPIPSRLL